MFDCFQPPELDALQRDLATFDTLWKLVEIPFMHHAKIILKFVKKIPGNMSQKLASSVGNTVWPACCSFIELSTSLKSRKLRFNSYSIALILFW